RAGIEPGTLDGIRAQASTGEVLEFNIDSSSTDPCSAPRLRGARVRVVSDRAIIVADTLNPAGGFTDADYQQFADFFDDEVWPLVTSTFGEPTDIDQNGKVFILFTRAVNDRSENRGTSGGSYVGGFF